MQDRRFLAFLADLIEASSGPKIPDITARALFAALAKRHGLTMTCAVLGGNL